MFGTTINSYRLNLGSTLICLEDGSGAVIFDAYSGDTIFLAANEKQETTQKIIINHSDVIMASDLVEWLAVDAITVKHTINRLIDSNVLWESSH